MGDKPYEYYYFKMWHNSLFDTIFQFLILSNLPGENSSGETGQVMWYVW